MDSLKPPSKISSLTQVIFVGAIAYNLDEHIEQKIFHYVIVVDNDKVVAEIKVYQSIPVITDFTNENGVNKMKEQIQLNYNHIKEETKQIVAEKLQQIKDDPTLSHFVLQRNKYYDKRDPKILRLL